MNPEEDFFNTFMEMSLIELKRKRANGIYGDVRGLGRHKLNLLELAIAEKEKEEEKIKFEKTIELAKDNVRATKRLVWATWGLVVVTLGLVIATGILAYITYNKK